MGSKVHLLCSRDRQTDTHFERKISTLQNIYHFSSGRIELTAESIQAQHYQPIPT